MAQLSQELAETNAVLRDVAAKLTAPGPAPTPVHPEPVPFNRIGPLAAMLALRAHLKPVPEEYGKVRRRDLAWAVCVCRRGHKFRESGFQECSCGRVFAFTGKRLYVMRPE